MRPTHGDGTRRRSSSSKPSTSAKRSASAYLSIAMSHRHFGIGADGLIVIHPSEIADARMQMFNADGSESEMCGNGIRCVAKYVYDHGICGNKSLTIETGAGVLSLEVEVVGDKVERVRVDMGEPILDALEIPTTFESTPVANQTLGKNLVNDPLQPYCPMRI